MTQYVVVRGPRALVSLRFERRAVVVTTALLVLTFAVLVVDLAMGSYPMSPVDSFRALLGYGDHSEVFLVQSLRLPRALCGILVGACLAVSGTIMQGVTRNPLASPDIMGVGAGASLGAVILIVVYVSAPISFVPVAALIGGMVAAGTVYGLSWRRGTSGTRLVLIGVGVSAVATAAVNFMVVKGNLQEVSSAISWLAGSLYGRGWEQFTPLLAWSVICLPLAWIFAPQLNILNLGDEVARGVGSRVERDRGLLLFLSVALAAAPVATAGNVGFVGLFCPHLVRRLVGPAHGGLIPAAAACGALTVIGADLIARTLFAPIDLPCGIVTSAVGAPYLIYLLYRGRHV